MTTFDHIARATRSRRLCKDPANGMIFGVCAGMAYWMGIKAWFVRVLMVLALLFIGGPVLLAYVVAALVLNRRKVGRYEEFVARFGHLGRGEDRYGRYDRYGR